MQTEILLATHTRRASTLALHYLGPILEEGDLMQTLETLVDKVGSTKRTAEALFLHSNSITYRLNEIRDRHNKVLLEMAMALRANRVSRVTEQ